MQIDEKLIGYLENLSCLTLTDQEKSRLSSDLEKILDYMDQLFINLHGVYLVFY